MITKEQEKEYHDAMDKYHDEMDAEWNKSKEELIGLIHNKYFDFIENHDTYYSIGVIDIIETNEKRGGYPNYKCCRVKDDSDKLLYMHSTDTIETLNEDSEYEGEEIEYYVWQTTGYMGDDYSGFLLLPLLDGKRFWKVGYTC